MAEQGINVSTQGDMVVMKKSITGITLLLLLLCMTAKSSMAACANPGKDGAAGALSGIINTYYRGNASVASGATSIPVNAADPYTTTGGAATPIAAGDLLLVIQMQDAGINSSNTSAYGDGTNGTGYTALNKAGQYEFVTATGAISGSAIPVTPLVYSYTNAAATATAGVKKYQIIRVPQYSSATLSGTNLTAIPWNGTVGGILAIDVAGQLNWGGGSINVTGRGFRGGGGRPLTGGAGANTDYRTSYTVNANANKGEGIAGTPNRYFTPTPASATTVTTTNAAGTVTNSAIEGYPNGSHGRGAPGNAGGGATDGNPAANNQNAGGGGGAGYGSGGKGGNAWSSGVTSGGFGGSGVTMNAAVIVAGGGGGAGSTNDSTGTPVAGVASSGAEGGGIVFIRANTITGSATISANGTNANSSVCQDGSGGGGGGGSVVVVASGGAGAVGTLSINAAGGKGGDNLQAGCGAHTGHGPGGGGGGGFVALSGTASINTAGGANGITVGSVPYGATSGTSGSSTTSLTPASLPGTSQVCIPLEVTKAPNVSTATPGTTISYTINYRNPNTYASQNNIIISDPIPLYMTYQSASCLVNPVGISACTPVFSPPPAGSGNGVVTWTLTGTLSPGASGSVQISSIIQ